jgi:DNA repair exonuclease SbcCD ATPase subunit
MDAALISDIVSGTVSTLIAAALTVVAFAKIKTLRLRNEFKELNNLLGKLKNNSHKPQQASELEAEIESLKKQIEDLMKEVAEFKDGALAVSHDFKIALRKLDCDIRNLVSQREAANIIQLLYGTTELGIEYQKRITSLRERVDRMAQELKISTLLIP